MVAAGDKAKKQKIEETDDQTFAISTDKIHHFQDHLQKKIQEFQDELGKINEEVSDEVLAVEQKYNTIRKPVYEKRNEVINTIPEFWLTAFLRHPVLGDLLSDEDQEIFKYLSSLEVDDYTDVKTGYSISFVFKPNPYFEDTKLTKIFAFLDEGTSKITATKIKWKEGMGLANAVADEKKGSKRPPADESFFAWFADAEFRSDMDDLHDEVADIIKDELWSNPLVYINNEADEEEIIGEEDDEEDDGTDSEEDEGEEDE